jgi:alpha-maltose-1-phosphate synthase
MRIVLQSNVSHYHHLADAFHRADWLERYITSINPIGNETLPSWLPKPISAKAEGRRISLPHALVRRQWLPEILQRALPKTRLISSDQGNWVNNHLFDYLASRTLPDCDVFHYVNSVGLYAARAAKRKGATVVCDIRQEHPAFQRDILAEESALTGQPTEIYGASYERKMLDEFQEADFLILPSIHASRTFVERGFDPRRILVLPYGVDLQNFTASAPKTPGFHILFVGHLTLRKGLHYLLEAVKRAKIPNLRVTLVGQVDPAMIPLLARYEGFFTHVSAVAKNTLKDYYSAASVFVLPSLADSFSLAVLEAMACGTPVIVSRNTGAADFVQDGKNGFVVPIRDSAAIGEKLELMANNPDLLAEMGTNALTVAQRQTWHRYGDEAISLYKQHIFPLTNIACRETVCS